MVAPCQSAEQLGQWESPPIFRSCLPSWTVWRYPAVSIRLPIQLRAWQRGYNRFLRESFSARIKKVSMKARIL
jgi:hypothetical protein